MRIGQEKRNLFLLISLKQTLYYICCLLFCTIFPAVTTSMVQMRVVKETANYGYFNNNLGDSEHSSQLVAAVPPSNFSGPKLLERLVGKCYNLTQEKYTFCPFQNITQYEVNPRWNAYQGILGIWSHWEIENNTFSGMIYKYGDSCGDINRSVKISVTCGPHEALLNVTEPSKCQYSSLFSTRYACHKDALLVYPRLNPELQEEWNQLFTEFHSGDITQKEDKKGAVLICGKLVKGYQVGLQKIFHKAGFSELIKKEVPEATTLAAPAGDVNTFIDLPSCNHEYKNLQNEVAKLNLELDALKLLMDLNKIHNRTNKPQRQNWANSRNIR